MLDEDGYYHNVHHHVEDDDGKDRTKECHEEHNGVAKETAVDRMKVVKHQELVWSALTHTLS